MADIRELNARLEELKEDVQSNKDIYQALGSACPDGLAAYCLMIDKYERVKELKKQIREKVIDEIVEKWIEDNV